MGESIFVQSDERRNDDYRSLRERFDSNTKIKAEKERQDKVSIACDTWFDVRAFGQVFAFKSKSKSDDENAVSIGVRGPVTIQTAVSTMPVSINSMQITKSVNLETSNPDPDKKGSDTMGMKHRVDYGVYVTYGSINCQLAEKTGFGDDDANKLFSALQTLFENDVSAARPDGSMEIVKLVWWEHNNKSGQYSSAQVHRSLSVSTGDKDSFPDVKIVPLEGLTPKVFP
jgi:CRISPR-associated protein Csd2